VIQAGWACRGTRSEGGPGTASPRQSQKQSDLARCRFRLARGGGDPRGRSSTVSARSLPPSSPIARPTTHTAPPPDVLGAPPIGERSPIGLPSRCNARARPQVPPDAVGRARWTSSFGPQRVDTKNSARQRGRLSPTLKGSRASPEAEWNAQDRSVHVVRSRPRALLLELRCVTMAYRSHSCKRGDTNRRQFDADFTGLPAVASRDLPLQNIPGAPGQSRRNTGDRTRPRHGAVFPDAVPPVLFAGRWAPFPGADHRGAVSDGVGDVRPGVGPHRE